MLSLSFFLQKIDLKTKAFFFLHTTQPLLSWSLFDFSIKKNTSIITKHKNPTRHVKNKTRHVDENECIPRWFLKSKERNQMFEDNGKRYCFKIGKGKVKNLNNVSCQMPINKYLNNDTVWSYLIQKRKKKILLIK